MSSFYDNSIIPEALRRNYDVYDRIRELGFRPGIWTVPFGTGDGRFYQAHKSWFLHDAKGEPMHNWCGLYVLDPSQEAVRRHMEETHRTMSEEWGYEYFKIDGMSGRGPPRSCSSRAASSPPRRRRSSAW